MFKVEFLREVIKANSFEDAVEKIGSVFCLKPDSYRFKYEDEEKDTVIITSEEEFKAVLEGGIKRFGISTKDEESIKMIREVMKDKKVYIIRCEGDESQ